MEPSEPALPNGARGIDLGAFRVDFQRDKIIAFLPGADHHFTLSLGPITKEFDVHKTWHDPDRVPKHERLGALEHSEFAAMCKDLEWIGVEYLLLFRPLDREWIRRRNIDIVLGLTPIGLAEFARVTTKRRRRLAVDPERFKDSLQILNSPDEFESVPDRQFTLVRQDGKKIGFGFKWTAEDGHVELAWIEQRAFEGLIYRVQAVVSEQLARRITMNPYRGE